MTNKTEMVILSGNSNPLLAKRIATILGTKLGKCEVGKFSDDEIRVEILEQVRGKDVFIFQPTGYPSNDNLMELLLLVDAAKRAKASHVTAVVPYYGYARQDRKPEFTRVPITAKLVADLMDTIGVDHIIVVDIHAAQIQGFFNFAVDNISSIPVMVADMYRLYSDLNPVVVSPDIGGVARARKVAKQLNNADLAIIDKRRPKANVSEVMNIIGNIKDRTCILFDDMVDTAGTLCKAASALKDNGAKNVVAYCTHPVLSGNAYDNIRKSVLDEVVVTDTNSTCPTLNERSRVRVISIADLLAETIHRIREDLSVSSMYVD